MLTDCNLQIPFGEYRNKQIIFPNTDIFAQLIDEHGNVLERLTLSTELVNINGQLDLMCVEHYDRMFVVTIDTNLYLQLKKSHSLNVSFGDFTNNLIKFLQESSENRIKMNLMQKQNGYEVQFAEEQSFRTFVHLTLPLYKASDTYIISKMKKNMLLLKENCEHKEKEIIRLGQQITHLQCHVDRLNLEAATNTKKLEKQRKLLCNREMELINKKRSETDYFESKMSKLRGLITQLRKQNMEILKQKELTCTENDTMKQKVLSLENQISALNFENDKLEKKSQKSSKAAAELKQENESVKSQNAKLNDLLLVEKKRQSHLKASLEAEKKVCEWKQDTLKAAVEEKNKAEEIIMQLTNDVTRLKKDISWRTNIALQQELVLHRQEASAGIISKHVIKLGNKLIPFRRRLENYKIILDDLKNQIAKLGQTSQNSSVL